MQTLDAPIYEVKQDSEWYQKEKKRRVDITKFFEKVKYEYNLSKGFGFYHSEYFGVHAGTDDYEIYKDEVVKNPDKNGMYAFKKRSKYYKPIKQLIDQIENVSPFKSHDVFGLNNITASQWVDNRWFFGVKHEKFVESDEVYHIDYREYLNVIMENLK